MKIEINGNHMEVTEALNNHANAKFKKLSERFPEVSSISITLIRDGQLFAVEILCTTKGKQISIQSKHADMYKAITEGARKLTRSLRQGKETRISGRKNCSMKDFSQEQAA